MTAPLSLPLYADRPQRKVPGTDVIAVTMYASGDRSVRHYTLFTAEGERLDNVAYHGRTLARAAGYHRGHGVWRHDSESWSNLTEAAIALLTEHNKEN